MNPPNKTYAEAVRMQPKYKWFTIIAVAVIVVSCGAIYTAWNHQDNTQPLAAFCPSTVLKIGLYVLEPSG
jgi:ABC-type thiamin/hydroxymethylpyrimidine transport system permease subunit